MTVTQTEHGCPVRRFVVDRPVTTYLAIVLPVAWANMLIPLAAGCGIGSLTLVASCSAASSVERSLSPGSRRAPGSATPAGGCRPVADRGSTMAAVAYGPPVLTVWWPPSPGTSASRTMGRWPTGSTGGVLVAVDAVIAANLWEELGGPVSFRCDDDAILR